MQTMVVCVFRTMMVAAPRKAVPGTSMAFRGIKDPEQRKALIAFLVSFNADGTRIEHN